MAKYSQYNCWQSHAALYIETSENHQNVCKLLLTINLKYLLEVHSDIYSLRGSADKKVWDPLLQKNHLPIVPDSVFLLFLFWNTMYRMRLPPNRYEMCVLRNSTCLCDSPKLCEQETESGERPILCFLQRFLVAESAAPWQKTNKQNLPQP